MLHSTDPRTIGPSLYVFGSLSIIASRSPVFGPLWGASVGMATCAQCKAGGRSDPAAANEVDRCGASAGWWRVACAACAAPALVGAALPRHALARGSGDPPAPPPALHARAASQRPHGRGAESSPRR